MVAIKGERTVQTKCWNCSRKNIQTSRCRASSLLHPAIFDKLNTQLASGTPADVFFLGGNVVDYANKGVLLELDPYVGSELDLTDMDESMVEYGTLGGKLLHIFLPERMREASL